MANLVNNNEWKQVVHYHAHVYFEESKLDLAEKVHELVAASWPDLAVGKIFQKPMGPHPVGNFQVLIPVSTVGEFIRWMSFNRHGLSVLFHPITTNQVDDHDSYSIWVGPSLSNINLSMLEKFDAAMKKMGLSDDSIIENVAYLRPEFVNEVLQHM